MIIGKTKNQNSYYADVGVPAKGNVMESAHLLSEQEYSKH